MAQRSTERSKPSETAKSGDARTAKTETRTVERHSTSEERAGEVFDPSKDPEAFGGTPQGEVPGEQAGDPRPQAEKKSG